MSERSDRLLIMLVAATGLAVLVVGWAGGLIEAQLSGLTELVLFGALALLFVGALVGFWVEFRRTDRDEEDVDRG